MILRERVHGRLRYFLPIASENATPFVLPQLNGEPAGRSLPPAAARPVYDTSNQRRSLFSHECPGVTP